MNSIVQTELASHAPFTQPLKLTPESKLEALKDLPFQNSFDAPNEHTTFSNASYGNNGLALGPCQHAHDSWVPSHDPLPLSEADISTCLAVAAEISGMPILQRPKFCMASHEDFPISMAMGRHYCSLNRWSDKREPHKLGVDVVVGALKFQSLAAVYLPLSNTILFEPMGTELLLKFGDTWPLKSILIHEMTHAAQFQNFSHLTRDARKLNKDVKRRANTPVKSVSDFLSLRRDSTKLAGEKSHIFLLFEGHAKWVQTQSGERVFQTSPKPIHQLGYRAYGIVEYINTYLPSPNIYSAGQNMIVAIEKLQQEFETAPFTNAAGQAVTLDPKLKGHGLVRLIFENPEMVHSLLPNYNSAWRRSVRETADVQKFRQFVLSLPSHVPLTPSV